MNPFLFRQKKLSHEIRNKSILATDDYNNLHKSDENIEKYSYDSLVQWVRSVKNFIERPFLLRNYGHKNE